MRALVVSLSGLTIDIILRGLRPAARSSAAVRRNWSWA